MGYGENVKKKLLFLNYLIWKPSDPGFRQKFEQLSSYYSGSILHLGTRKKVSAGKFTFFSIQYRSNLFLRQLQYIIHCVRGNRKYGPFDVIISYDPLICGIAGVIVKLLSGAKLIVEVNTDHFWSLKTEKQSFQFKMKNMVKSFCMQLSFHFADGVKIINTPLTLTYSKKFNFKKKQLPVATFFSFIATQSFRKTGYMPQGEILCVGHPYHIKGVDVLIKAFNRISKVYPECKLKIIGHCEDRKPYLELAGDNANITFCKGMYFEDIVTEFERCRFLILPSRTEGIPRVLIEAMACGKPVIGSRVGGISEVIVDNETGLLFESENDQDLAEKIRMLLDDTRLEQRLGNAGYERAQKKFSPEKYALLYKQFIENL